MVHATTPGGVLPMIGYTGRLRQKGVPFYDLGIKRVWKMTFFRYFKGSLKKAGVSESYWYFKGYQKPQGKRPKTGNSVLYIAPR